MKNRFTALLLVLLFALAACTPVANIARDTIERPDGATLTFLQDGLGIDPGAEVARSGILIVMGDDIANVVPPEGATCELEAEVLDCRLGDVSERVVVGLTGTDLFANFTFRRPGSTTVHQVFAR